MAFAYLTLAYFDELVYRVENSDSDVVIGVEDKDKWIEEFKKARPLITSIELIHVKGNRYKVSANV